MCTWKLIKEAQQECKINKQKASNINTSFRIIAEQVNVDRKILVEGVTHVLSNFDNVIKGMNIKSVIAFLAGVAQIAKALPASTDEQRKQSSLRMLAAAAMNFNDLTDQSLPNEAMVKIAQFGVMQPDLIQKYTTISQQGSEALVAEARKLSQEIDRAMNVAKTPQTNRPATAGPSIVSAPPATYR